MTDPHFKKITNRAKDHIALAHGGNPKSMQKTPSQKRSENMRKKLLRGGKPEPEPQFDCCDCEKEPCGFSLKRCDKASLIGRCVECGQRTRYRLVEGQTWKMCKNCREMKK